MFMQILSTYRMYSGSGVIVLTEKKLIDDAENNIVVAFAEITMQVFFYR